MTCMTALRSAIPSSIARLLTATSLALLTACGGGGGGGGSSDAAGGGTSGASTSGSTAAPGYATMANASLGIGANANGDIPFPASNPINTDISGASVDPNSANLINSIGMNTGLHPDFGAFPYGIPYVIVDQSQALVTVTINQGTGYPGDSDIAPMPIPPNAPVEGGLNSGGDSHVLVVDRSNNKLYEMWHAAPAANNNWTADQSSIFDLTSNNWRPTKSGQCDVTSADAAGLPIFPLLARYEEVESGEIKHAMRMTVQSSREAYVPPASHWASSSTNVNLPPMGMRVRLKSSYVIPNSFSKESRVMLQAMQKYGLIVADNGSNWYITGATDSRWPIDTMVSELRQVEGSNFEVVTMTGLITPTQCP
jgi:hypothetical protein